MVIVPIKRKAIMSKSKNDCKPGMWLILHDLHYPLVNWPAWNAALDFLSQNEITGFIFGGDQFDNAEISHHTKGKPLFRERGAYDKNTNGFRIKILDVVDKLLIGKEKVYIIGNHERFESDLIEEQPELEGTIEHVKLLELEKRGWKIVPLGHAYKLGKLNVIHGEILTGYGNQGPAYPSRKAVELYGANVLAGHTHAPQSFSKISPVEASQKFMGWIAPCMCDSNPAYLRNRPTAWVNGFTIVEVMDNGNFNLYPIIISSGKFSFGGKMYGG
jgi:predicted phosphodiesterase